MKRLIIFLFLLSSYTGRTQTIVNTYDLITPIDSIWSATTELQGTFAAGNGVFTALNSGLGLGRTINSKTEAWFLGGYNYASESGNSIYSTGFLNTRLHYSLPQNLQLQLFYQGQFNSALELDQRSLFGVNFGKSLFTKEYIYKFTAGSFRELEIYSDKSEMNLFRGNIAASITTEFSDVDVHLTLYFQPDLNSFVDYRMLGELALQFPISEQLEFEVESALRYDSDPHLNLLPLDFSTVIGMVYSISN